MTDLGESLVELNSSIASGSTEWSLLGEALHSHELALSSTQGVDRPMSAELSGSVTPKKGRQDLFEDDSDEDDESSLISLGYDLEWHEEDESTYEPRLQACAAPVG